MGEIGRVRSPAKLTKYIDRFQKIFGTSLLSDLHPIECVFLWRLHRKKIIQPTHWLPFIQRKTPPKKNLEFAFRRSIKYQKMNMFPNGGGVFFNGDLNLNHGAIRKKVTFTSWWFQPL